eukprot:3835054-Lingulodinium_polyedra.AAC.1
MRQPPFGGRRAECALCKMRCVSERVSEQPPRKSCAEMRSGTHSIPAMPRVSSRNAHSMRRPPHG